MNYYIKNALTKECMMVIEYKHQGELKMKFNKLVLGCGVISALTLGVLGNNTYAEEVNKMNDTIHFVEHIPTDILLTQTMDYSGEAITSFCI